LAFFWLENGWLFFNPALINHAFLANGTETGLDARDG
jgi:hypothetical protein